VFRQARLWERIEKSVRVEAWTIPGDPMRMDYSYLRNGTRGFVHTLSVTHAPGDLKQRPMPPSTSKRRSISKPNSLRSPMFPSCPATSATIMLPPPSAMRVLNLSLWKASPHGLPSSNPCSFNNFCGGWNREPRQRHHTLTSFLASRGLWR
jgi:hypothetical protein